jgi:hypothetical protein
MGLIQLDADETCGPFCARTQGRSGARERIEDEAYRRGEGVDQRGIRNGDPFCVG